MSRTQIKTMVKAERTGRSKPFFFTVAVLCLMFGTAVSGCSGSSHDIDAKLAGEIAVDASGCPKGDVKDLSVSESDAGYTVTFANGKGLFTIEINADGAVTEYSFEAGAKAPDPSAQSDEGSDQSSDGKGNVDPNNADPGNANPNSEQNGENNNGTSSDETTNSSNSSEGNDASNGDGLPEGSLTKSELISRAAALISLEKYNEADFHFEMNGESLIVTTTGPDGTQYTITMNPYNGSGTYTFVKN